MWSEMGNLRGPGVRASRFRRSAAAVLLAGLVALAPVFTADSPAATGDKQVYSFDFEGPIGPEWSSNVAELSPSGNIFLGRFGDFTSTLRLNGLPAHERLLVELDMYIFDSMDGNDTGPGSGEEENGVADPDVFTYRGDGKLIKRTTFSNRHPQAFPGDYPGGDYPAKTGASDIDSLGYDEDTTFPVSLSFRHSGKKVKFSTTASGLDDLNDESWGFDNVVVAAQRDCKVLKKQLAKAKRKAKKAKKKYKKAKAGGSAKKLKKSKKKLRKAKKKKRKAKATYRKVCK